MKVAIPILTNNGENSSISEHFGHAPYFAFIEFQNPKDEILHLEIVANPMLEHGPGEIPQYMKNEGISVLIARGIGGKAIQFFSQMGIQVFRGASGNVREIFEALRQNSITDLPYEVQNKLHEH